MRILIASSKGGVGKSTTALLLTLALREAGNSVSVEDKDPQQTLSSALEDKGGTKGNGKGSQFTIIDVPPRHEHLEGEIGNASVTLVPLSPSIPDVWATKDWLATMGTPKGKTFLLWNKYRPGAPLMGEVEMERLREQIGLPALKSRLTLRTSYDGRLFLDGWRALNGPARTEALTLALEVAGS